MSSSEGQEQAHGAEGQRDAQEEAVHTLMAMTGMSDAGQAHFLLEASGGNLEAALQLFLETEQSAPPPRPPSPPPRPSAALSSPPPPRPLAPAQRQPPRSSSSGQRLPTQLLGLAARLPLLILRGGLHTVAQALAFSVAAFTFLGDRVLPRFMSRGVRGVLQALLGRPRDADPAAQARMFIQQFRSKYGERHPPFVPMGAKQASLQARSEHRFLFVYLHSADHQDTDEFCRNVLCSQELLDLLQQQFVCWGGDVRCSDAHALSASLGTTTFPFTALLSYGFDNKVSLVAAAQGCVLLQPGLLQYVLTTAVADHGALLVAQREDMRERDMNRRLMHEQNREYEESLEADRVRDMQREQERQRQEAQRREQEEAEARARAEQEAAEQRVRDREAAIAQRREAKRASLPPAPAPGSGTPESPVTHVRVRLPDGSNALRSFAAGSTLGNVYDFVDSLDSTNYWNYNLASSYPRRVYGHDKLSMPLEALDLGTQIALFVQPVDDDDQ